MKRSITELTKWQDYERKLLSSSSFKNKAQKLEAEYQIAKNITELRLDKCLSQSELAKRIGSKQPVISRLESGRSQPTLSLLQRVATALDAKVEVKLKRL